MSSYVLKKAIRYPINDELLKYYKVEDYYFDLEEKLKEIDKEFGEFPPKNKFELDSGYNEKERKEKYYIDFVITYKYGADSGDFGISQLLNKEQHLKYKEMFSKFIPNIDENKFRLVKFCYYNGVDCPDYYEVTPPMTDEDEDIWNIIIHH